MIVPTSAAPKSKVAFFSTSSEQASDQPSVDRPRLRNRLSILPPRWPLCCSPAAAADMAASESNQAAASEINEADIGLRARPCH
jgi:hypothetical protein